MTLIQTFDQRSRIAISGWRKSFIAKRRERTEKSIYLTRLWQCFQVNVLKARTTESGILGIVLAYKHVTRHIKQNYLLFGHFSIGYVFNLKLPGFSPVSSGSCGNMSDVCSSNLTTVKRCSTNSLLFHNSLRFEQSAPVWIVNGNELPFNILYPYWMPNLAGCLTE